MKDFLLPNVSVIVAEIPKSASLTAPETVNKIFAPCVRGFVYEGVNSYKYHVAGKM